ncbi:phosphohistidine phosphatase SixA [candidate division KSB3 bacterium]|uniref:Phosphohistidine phosphatase SixA n=1 Tax=candidate division KSB3 bacterium TaxID=2044937 RepID=A0A2G6KJU4_9BACT|nr:MAG: phosphohistidine phosphatase SixA [candidate division KSB3 bacterium]
MKLYLMQHGNALSKQEHSDRPLSEKGKRDVTKTAAFLVQADVQIDQIHHSGKTRAQETAEIVGKLLQTETVAVTGIAPNDNVCPVAESLQTKSRSVMLVGHLPFMSRLTSYLLTGSAEQTIVQFQQSSVVCLDYQNGFWTIGWMIVPEVLEE